ncbi:unnamed protein product [Cylindrotheca closterium]|uniref:Uncharacterized protein n=1 Tax=Cylindrotheca closterium TaxID=2856 RepID=A0AAD2CM18_9STRA|nr:unnamed protein product [Cylindrotheca closterium]
MKFFGTTLLALAASTAAFTPATSGPKSSALFSAPPPPGPGTAPPGLARGNPVTQQIARSGNSHPQSAAVWDASQPVLVQGGSLKTWSFASPAVERVQVVMKTEGRPLDANLELWQGPDNTPYKMRVYVEDGAQRSFNCVIETPRGPNTVAIRNTANLEFPLVAGVVPSEVRERISPMAGAKSTPRTIQGGALRTYPFDPNVESVRIVLQTDGRPLNSRIELLQGPNNIKQVMELYTEDGMDRPYIAIIETPGSGNVVRVVNTATMEFPLTALVEADMIGDGMGGAAEAVLGGDGPGFMLDRAW